jgi:hypothetical protein
VGDSSSGQEESTVDVGLHSPVELLGSDVGDASLVVLLVSRASEYVR